MWKEDWKWFRKNGSPFFEWIVAFYFVFWVKEMVKLASKNMSIYRCKRLHQNTTFYCTVKGRIFLQPFAPANWHTFLRCFFQQIVLCCWNICGFVCEGFAIFFSCLCLARRPWKNSTQPKRSPGKYDATWKMKAKQITSEIDDTWVSNN